NLTTLVATARVASPAIDVLIVSPPENGRSIVTYPLRIAEYAKRARKVARAQKCTHFDMQSKFGRTYADYGFASAVMPLFNNDDLHPSLVGGVVQQDARLRLLQSSI